MYFNFQDIDIYYEVHGTGEPLLLLNGIMMTTKSWAPLVKTLSRHHQLILVDFVDQGQSGKLNREYKQDIQVELLRTLIQHLNLEKVLMCGISYGGEVAIQFCLKYQEFVEKLILFNTPPKTSYWLSEIGKSWEESMRDPYDFYYSMIPLVYSPQFYNTREVWMEQRKETLIGLFSQEDYLKTMSRLIFSAEGYSSLSRLHEILCPTLVVGSEVDMITPFYQQKLIHEKIPHSELVMIPDCGHGTMYEKPETFVSLIIGFCLTPAGEIVI